MPATERDGAGIVSVAVPCRADEPSLGVVFGEILAQCEPSSLPMPRSLELLFCINGVGAPAGITPLDDLRQLCAQHGIPLTEEWVTAAPHRSLAAEPIGRVPHSADAARSGAAARMTSARAILTATEGKAHAWNLLRRACSGDPVIVCDADVTFSPGAFRRLYDGLLASPTLALFSPKTDCRHDGSLLERILAVPYRLDFPNLSGQLYAMRPERAPDFMPEDLLEPERWLELEVGPEHVGRDPGARVYVRLTATMRDFFRQRIRIEMGKVQLHDAYSHLLGRSRPQPGGAAVRTLALAERGALGAYLVLRSLAHARAWWRYHHGRRAGIWAQPATTKYWPDGVLRTGSRSLSAYSGPSSVGGGGPAARRDSAGNAPGIVEEVATPQTGRLRPRGDGSAYSDRLLGHRRTERHRLSSRPGGEATPMRILFLTPRFPYPALRGDQVRAYHQIRLLGRQHAVTLLALSERRVEPDAEAHVRGMCEALHIEPLSWGRQLSGLGRILVGDPRPVQTLLYSAAGRATVKRLIDSGGFDVVHAQLLRTAGLLPPAPRTPVVIDLVDTLSASYARRGAIAPVWLRPALAVETRRLVRYEHRLLQGGARCLVVSEAERQALGVPGERAIVNPNGVDPAAFPFTPGQGRAHRVMFVGNLGYAPNIDAASWFADEVFPRIRAEIPQSEFIIVGPRAPRRIRTLAERPGITLAGVVTDVHQWLATAQVAVGPLRAGGGIQNKVLEAMAAGTPVVATSRAVRGVNVAANVHCLIADDAASFAEAVTTLFRRADLRRALAHAAHDLVTAGYTWERTVGDLEALYQEMVGAAGEAGVQPDPADGVRSTAGRGGSQATAPTHGPASGTAGSSPAPTGRP